MKKTILILLLVITSFLGFSEERCQVLIYGLDYVPPTAIHSVPTTRYYVDCAQLRNSPAWNTHEKFPLSLGAESRQAASFISAQKNVNSNLDLQCVSIRNCRLPDSAFAQDNSKGQLSITNRWFIVFTFSTETPGQLFSAVVLLNGVYAEERTTTPDSSSVVIKSAGLGIKAREFDGTNAPKPFLEKLRSPNFSMPATQWDTSKGECPVNLEHFVELGVSCLRKEYSLAGNRLELKDMDFYRFIPGEAITAQHLDPEVNLHHWFCVMKFTTDGEEHEYMAYLLLDGTVVQTSIADKVSRQEQIQKRVSR